MPPIREVLKAVDVAVAVDVESNRVQELEEISEGAILSACEPDLHSRFVYHRDGVHIPLEAVEE